MTVGVGFRALRPGDSGWPRATAILGRHAPAVLWWYGDAWIDGVAAVAVVGSRRPSAAGLAVAHDLSRSLALAGVTVVSGFARGIDAAAHAGAVAAGGRTVAVCGCGVDVDYPRGHTRLRDALVNCGGAVVSEFAPGTEPRPWQFPQRNRIIAALAQVTIVVEAGESSGALSTARWAADLGREVMAVPGPLHSGVSRGTNRLIRDGVRPYLEIDDVFDVLGVGAGSALRRVETGRATGHDGSIPADAVAHPVATLLAGGPVHPDLIAGRLGLGAAEVAVQLSMLELQGRIRTVPGGCVELTRTG